MSLSDFTLVSNIPRPKKNLGSSDYIPFAINRPLARGSTHSTCSNTSYNSSSSMPRSFNSIPNYSPYKNTNFRGNISRIRRANPNQRNKPYPSSTSTPRSLNSSVNCMHYPKNYVRGNFNRGRSNLKRNKPNPPHISTYVCKEMLENPWAELEAKLKLKREKENSIADSENSQNSTENKTLILVVYKRAPIIKSFDCSPTIPLG